MTRKKIIDLTTPGEILKEEFLDPLGLKDVEVANALDIPASRLSEIIHGKRVISLDTAMRLSIYFKTTPQFWLNLQNNYDLQKLIEKSPRLFRAVRPLQRKKHVTSSFKVT